MSNFISVQKAEYFFCRNLLRTCDLIMGTNPDITKNMVTAKKVVKVYQSNGHKSFTNCLLIKLDKYLSADEKFKELMFQFLLKDLFFLMLSMNLKNLVWERFLFLKVFQLFEFLKIPFFNKHKNKSGVN